MMLMKSVIEEKFTEYEKCDRRKTHGICKESISRNPSVVGDCICSDPLI